MCAHRGTGVDSSTASTRGSCRAQAPHALPPYLAHAVRLRNELIKLWNLCRVTGLELIPNDKEQRKCAARLVVDCEPAPWVVSGERHDDSHGLGYSAMLTHCDRPPAGTANSVQRSMCLIHPNPGYDLIGLRWH